MSMLKWVDGAKPGKKRKVAALKDTKKEYEKTRVRRFQTSWKTDRPWLIYDDANEKMYCSYCQSFKETNFKNPFVTGCSNFKIEGLNAHASTKAHQKALMSVEGKLVKIDDTQAAKSLTLLKESERAKLNILFRNAHFVAKQNLSFKMYVAMCNLDKSKGLDVGDTYLNDKSCMTFIKSISSTEKTKTQDVFQNCPFIGLTCDGTSDFTGDDYESIFIRASVQGRVTERFVGVGTANSGSGEDIFHHIDTNLQELAGDGECDYWEKICGFCADGAANMQGKNKGVAAFIRQKNQETCIIHCMAHRVELAYKDALKKFKLYDKAITLLMGLYYLYRKSPKMKKELKQTFTVLNKKEIMPTRIGGTRWLPHMSRAIAAFQKGYVALRLHLDTSSHKNAKAEGLARLLTDQNVIVFILDLKAILEPLTALSLTLQEKGSSLGDNHWVLKSTYDVLDHMKSSLNEEVKQVCETKKYMNEDLKGSASTGYHEPLLECLLKCLSDRFEMTNIVKSSYVMSFKNWPNKQQSKEFGNEAVQALFDHFHATLQQGGFTDCSNDELIQQWVFLKSFVYNKFDEKDIKKLLWENVLPCLPEPYRNIQLVIDLLLSLPPTSVNNETCFSLAKLTKTKRRGHLTTECLSDLLAVEIGSPAVTKFDPSEAINHWMVTPSGRRRRLCYTRSTPVKESTKQPTEATEPIVDCDEESEHLYDSIETQSIQLDTSDILIATKLNEDKALYSETAGPSEIAGPSCVYQGDASENEMPFYEESDDESDDNDNEISEQDILLKLCCDVKNKHVE